jgi:hypothetical protein
MPENRDEQDDFDEQAFNEQGFDEEDDFDAADDLDDDDGYEPGEAGHAWPARGYPPAGFPPPPGRPAARRGWAFTLTAVVAAAAAFGVADVALHEASGSPAASATPGASAPAEGDSGGGAPFAPGPNGAPLPSGAAEHLLIGGKVTAVSATSITLGSGGQAVTAAVNHATKVTGKVTGISGIRVGDLVSASLTGTSGGKLTADSIQDPASLPSGPGQ